MPEVSTKPYLIRAICDWCNDAGFTPYIAVAVDESVRVPMEFVKNGEIVLNVSALATNRLKIGNDAIEFQARFSGVPREVYVPIARVIAVYARENGQGMAFEVARGEQPAGIVSAAEAPAERGALVPVTVAPQSADTTPEPPPAPRPGERPKLTRVK
jgi:stringent starvation protein B